MSAAVWLLSMTLRSATGAARPTALSHLAVRSFDEAASLDSWRAQHEPVTLACDRHAAPRVSAHRCRHYVSARAPTRDARLLSTPTWLQRARSRPHAANVTCAAMRPCRDARTERECDRQRREAKPNADRAQSLSAHTDRMLRRIQVASDAREATWHRLCYADPSALRRFEETKQKTKLKM